MKGLLFELFTLASMSGIKNYVWIIKCPKFTDKQIGINTNWKKPVLRTIFGTGKTVNQQIPFISI